MFTGVKLKFSVCFVSWYSGMLCTRCINKLDTPSALNVIGSIDSVNLKYN